MPKYTGGILNANTPYTEGIAGVIYDASLPGVWDLQSVAKNVQQNAWRRYPWILYSSQEYVTPGTYTFYASSLAISAVAVGGGSPSQVGNPGAAGSGGGGGLGYRNLYPSSPGEEFTVFVGSASQTSYVRASNTDLVVSGNGASGSTGGGRYGDGGGNGGNGGPGNFPTMAAGGGAGGYSGNGGNGGFNSQNGFSGSGGGGGGGKSVGATFAYAGGGGGVGIYGEGGSGVGASITTSGPPNYNTGGRGLGGSGGTPSVAEFGNVGGFYGGGGGSYFAGVGSGQPGAVRIIWGPENNRLFPNTNTFTDGESYL